VTSFADLAVSLTHQEQMHDLSSQTSALYQLFSLFNNTFPFPLF